MSRLFQWGDRTKLDDRARNSPERAQALMKEAASALEKKDSAAARPLYLESISIFHSRNMRREEADALHALGLMLVSESDYPAAFDAYEQAIAIYRKLNVRGQLAVTLRDSGYASIDAGDLDAANELLNESLVQFEATSDKVGMASALECLGIAAHERKDIETSREFFRRSLGLHRELDLNPESAVSLGYLSMLALEQQELDTAEALYRESIDRFKEDNPESSTVPPLLTLGDVAFTTHDSVQIGELLQAALAVFGSSRLKRSWDSAMVKLGGVAQRRNVNRSKLEVYRHSLSVDPARDEWGSEAIACLGLGCVAYRQDRPKIGKALISRSLNLCRTNGDAETILYVLSYAAAYTYRCQHYPDSRMYHVQCADAARSAEDTLQAADALCYAAFLASWLGEFEDARKYCVECVAEYRAKGLTADMARAQSLLASIFCSRGDVETGEKIHAESVAICRRLGDDVAIALALSSMGASLARTRGEQALECLRECLEILNNRSEDVEAEALHNMGEACRLTRRHIESYGYLLNSMEIRVADADRYGCALSLLSAGLIAADSKQFESAAVLLAKAASIRNRIGVPLFGAMAEESAAAEAAIKDNLDPETLKRIAAKSDDLSLSLALEKARAIRELVVDKPGEEPAADAEGENEPEDNEPETADESVETGVTI